jgi:hypothetical protein
MRNVVRTELSALRRRSPLTRARRRARRHLLCLRLHHPASTHRPVQINQRNIDIADGLPLHHLRIELIPLGVKPLDLAGVAVLVAQLRQFQVVVQRRHLALLVGQLFACLGMSDQAVGNLAEHNPSRLLVAQRRFPCAASELCTVPAMPPAVKIGIVEFTP